jgi:hypothetical protein
VKRGETRRNAAKRGAKNAARRGDFNLQKTIKAAATIKRGGKR